MSTDYNVVTLKKIIGVKNMFYYTWTVMFRNAYRIGKVLLNTNVHIQPELFSH